MPAWRARSSTASAPRWSSRRHRRPASTTRRWDSRMPCAQRSRGRLPGVAAAGIVAAVLAVAAALFAGARRLLNRTKLVGRAKIRDPEESTRTDPRTGAVTSIQAAELSLPESAVQEIWTPRDLERLARTYWRFLSRCTLGIIRVKYTEAERFVCILFRPFVLLSFKAPEYEMDDRRGVVRWRIEKGVLVSKPGRGRGYLEIDVQRRPSGPDGRAILHVEVEVANFYPSLASGIGNWFYANTQSRIHVIVTHGFLRSLARLDLAESRVGRFASVEDVPDPQAPPREPVNAA